MKRRFGTLLSVFDCAGLCAHATKYRSVTLLRCWGQHVEVFTLQRIVVAVYAVILAPQMLDVATVIVYSGGYIFLVFLSVCLGNVPTVVHV